MSPPRDIENGDFVELSHSNNSSIVYTIQSIVKSGPIIIIYIKPVSNPNIYLSLNVYPSGKISVSGTSIQYDIKFLPHPSFKFTGDKDIDMNVLAQLDDESLFYASQINKYSSQLYQNPTLWKIKIENLESSVIPYLNKEKKNRDYYFHIKEIFSLLGNLDISIEEIISSPIISRIPSYIIPLHIPQIYDNEIICSPIFSNNLLNIVGSKYPELIPWLYYCIKLPPDINVVNSVSEKGYLFILEWMDKINLYNKLVPDSTQKLGGFYGSNLAAKYGHIDILEWYEHHGALPDVEGVNSAASSGHIGILNWLEKRKILPNKRGANLAGANGHIPVLKWLKQRGIYPNEFSVDSAIDKKHKDTLWYMMKQKIYPTLDGINIIPSHGWIDILEYLEKISPNLLPDDMGAINAVMNGQLKTLKWLAKREIYPIEGNIFFGNKNSVYDENIDVLKWLVENKIIEEEDLVFDAICTCETLILDWLYELKVLPENRIKLINDSQNQDKMIKWIIGKGIKITQEDVKYLSGMERENDDQNIIDILFKHGFYI